MCGITDRIPVIGIITVNEEFRRDRGTDSASVQQQKIQRDGTDSECGRVRETDFQSVGPVDRGKRFRRKLEEPAGGVTGVCGDRTQ